MLGALSSTPKYIQSSIRNRAPASNLLKIEASSYVATGKDTQTSGGGK